MERTIERIAILGAGAWGTALAVTAARAGRRVVLIARTPELAAAIAAERVNRRYLPGVTLPSALDATADASAAGAADALLLAVPAQHLRQMAGRLAGTAPIVICAKGIERGSGARMSEVAASCLPQAPLAVLSGPTFAGEVARGLPAAVTLASRVPGLAEALAAALGTAAFRPYVSHDVVGVEIGGAVKNVIAIACGVVEGLGLGENARAALVTRGLAETTRLALALGGRAETLAGLSGLGDLVLTATAAQSRNYALGLALGRGARLADALAGRHSVAEGVETAPAVLSLAARVGVEMPIAAAVDAVLHRDADVTATAAALLARPFRAE